MKRSPNSQPEEKSAAGNGAGTDFSGLSGTGTANEAQSEFQPEERGSGDSTDAGSGSSGTGTSNETQRESLPDEKGADADSWFKGN